MVFGDPHFVTFDGVGYSFNGKGEYNLVTSEKKQLTIQGRTEPMSGETATDLPLNATSELLFRLDEINELLCSLSETINATKLTAVAMKEANFDTVEVRVSSDQNSLEVLRDHKSLSFSEQSWMDLNGDFPPFHHNDVCASSLKKC